MHIYEVLKDVLDLDDFTSAVYREVFSAIGTLWKETGNVFPAELLNFFEEPEQQKQVTEVFTVQLPKEEDFDLQKTVNEAVLWMKRARIDRMAAKVSSVEEIQNLVEAKKKLDVLHITI